jgi:H+/Cl- antiporter ClcA
VLWLGLLATAIGAVAALLAQALLKLIALFTNVFYYGHWNTAAISPAGNHLGLLSILVPVVGGIIVGVMARYGSERIRGHGIPEALEAILVGGSKVEPKVAVLKPVSSAISIGSGGPFGAEGPIIMTGGAFGSMVAQLFHLSGAERKTLLVAGAAGGMSATFASPIAAVLLAVEVMLFEWKPRSLVPVALASGTAAAMRRYLLGVGPLFPTVVYPAAFSVTTLLACFAGGVIGGAIAALLTQSIYFCEDHFERLPVHWMWWPALSGIFVGLGGLVFPQALGVGYDVIGQFVRGDYTVRMIVGILVVKWLIWAVSLGSGTSGGVLAPLMMIGAALGGATGLVLPHAGAGFWPLVGLTAVMSGAMRAPLAAVVFAVEETHDLNLLLPLLLTSAGSYCLSALVLRRSILTEKVARRGYHLSAEYAVDPLEVLFVREVMRTHVAVLPAERTLEEVAQRVRGDDRHADRLLPVVDAVGSLCGIITRSEIALLVEQGDPASLRRPLAELARPNPVAAHPEEPLRAAVNRMAENGVTRLPVVEGDGSGRLVGIISIDDVLKARMKNLEQEQRRERILLPLRFVFPVREHRSVSNRAE